jgi:hypothetical protein
VWKAALVLETPLWLSLFPLGFLNGFFGLLNDESVDLGQNCFGEYDASSTTLLTSLALSDLAQSLSVSAEMEKYGLRVASATSGAFAGARV